MADRQLAIDIRADVQGREAIVDLTKRLDDMATVLGGEVADQARAAAQRLRELTGQQDAVATFEQLKAQARDAARELKAADREVANFAAQIAAAGPPTTQEAASLQRLQAAADTSRASFTQQQQALAGAQAQLSRYGISSKDTQAAQQRLRAEVDQVRSSVQSIAPAYNTSAGAAQAAGATMTRTHRAVGDGVQSISEQLTRMRALYAGFVGLQSSVGILRDVAQTADAYANLQARIKGVTGEGPAFEAAWAGVAQVAQRTNSDLEQTGQLFTRLVDSGKSAGQSTQQAISQALALTETINQSIQLSGGSADAAKASITQLVQGLSSGVLRGDEFNSVMEQSPRLAKALADGLGVTTGELRKMAEAGQLSSATVIKALQGQSDVVASEFEKLPPTVGRAVQSLSNAWMQYIGQVSEANGASTGVASVIQVLANNLDTLAGFLMDAGQAASAYAALRLAQHFLGISGAIQQTTTQVAANTVATAANTVALRAQAAAAGQVGTSAQTAAVGGGRLAAVLGTLKTLSLLGLVTNFKDIGTWLGEAAARAAGFKDRTDEIARAEKTSAEIAAQNVAMRQRMAAVTQAAIDKQFELSKSAQGSIAEFDKLTKEGTAAGEAIAKIGKDFDLATVPGIRDAAAVLDKLAADGKVSAAQVQAAWADALKGQDLAVFETQARAAFAGSAREAQRLAQVMDATLGEAVRRTGLDMDVISGGMGRAARSAINDTEAIIQGLDRLKAQGVDVGQVLATSLSRSIQAADSQAALDTVTRQIETVRTRLGEKVTDGLLDQAKQKATELKDALDKATPGITSLGEAMKLLGITSDESLRKTAEGARNAYGEMTSSGQASARELSEGFRKAADAAIAAAGGIVPEWVKAEAGARGFEVAADTAGKAVLRAMGEAGSAVDALGRGFDRTSDKIGRVLTQMEELEQRNETVKSTMLTDKQGFSADDKGNRITMGGDLTTRTGIMNFLRNAGVSDEGEARRITSEFADKKGDIPYFSNPGQRKYGGDTISMALLKAAETFTFDPSRKDGGAPPVARSERTVNVNLNGRSLGSVRTDDEGQATIDRLMTELADAAGRS